MNNAKGFILILFHILQIISISKGQLKVGFYSQTCPNAESIVKSVVKEATLVNPQMPPVLLRLHFHDCFVEGCDGSILITENVSNPEIGANAHQGVEGFEQINDAKKELETQCPGVVSCADIVAMAARDAIFLAGGPSYNVETGRRDGKISNIKLAADMPDVDDQIDTLKSKFRNKGLSEKDLVLLSGGAHTIGTAACFFMSKRLYNFTGKDNFNDSDPKINPNFLPVIKNQCPKDGDFDVRIPLDAVTSDKFDDQSLRNIKNGTAVLSSDARLYDDEFTRQVVNSYADVDQNLGLKKVSSFAQDFAKAMVKMGRIGVKVGSDGEIRRVCNSFN
ncbi:hypothetical protein BUALT_Bualt08G0108600 [Buddleja alternifolia]|uniref:Peroxidase n=1 Tax=Buddleja alternifolia TaxID=168488 RepID=A0AAV6X9A5_9LAMI|nr:hypothetical protein BUALT_Bualt08G0108600 [Buddleja alternifolia]